MVTCGWVCVWFLGIMQILKRTAKRISLLVLTTMEIKITIVFAFLLQLSKSLPKFTGTQGILLSASVVI